MLLELIGVTAFMICMVAAFFIGREQGKAEGRIDAAERERRAASLYRTTIFTGRRRR